MLRTQAKGDRVSHKFHHRGSRPVRLPYAEDIVLEAVALRCE